MSIDPVTQGPLRMVHPQLEGLLNAAIDGVLILDHKSRIRLMSRIAERMFGYSEADMLGYEVSHLLPEYHDSSHAQEPQFWAMRGTCKGAVTMAAGLQPNWLPENSRHRPPRYVAFVRDISDRVRREVALRQAKQRYIPHNASPTSVTHHSSGCHPGRLCIAAATPHV
jgi:two-component system sensor kinase FixL